jgi:hypothetical protein
MKTSHEANHFPFLFSFFVPPPPRQSKQSPHHPIPEHSLNTLSLYHLLNLTEQFYAHTTKNNVIVVCILMIMISENMGGVQRSELKDTT